MWSSRLAAGHVEDQPPEALLPGVGSEAESVDHVEVLGVAVGVGQVEVELVQGTQRLGVDLGAVGPAVEAPGHEVGPVVLL